jgi:hypothetical protein
MSAVDQFHGMKELAFEDGDGYAITISPKVR